MAGCSPWLLLLHVYFPRLSFRLHTRPRRWLFLPARTRMSPSLSLTFHASTLSSLLLDACSSGTHGPYTFDTFEHGVYIANFGLAFGSGRLRHDLQAD
ncbi:hypothetical protein DFH11DRAFT_1307595 [Phellopilus nigrolimitatus]|nr:hypothetical protein DFH11DRAFT_1307595 [Phellopilus nigrolimitatus]